MDKSSSEESAICHSPSVESRDSDLGGTSRPGLPCEGRGFTAAAFYGSTGTQEGPGTSTGNKSDTGKRTAAKGSKYLVFYLDLSFVFLLEFNKVNMARGCLCCLKYMMFLFNLIFWLCGCGLLGVGIWLSVSQGSFATFSPSFPSLSAANLVITIGSIIMVTGFLGCLGAIKENKCLLLSFFIVLLIILLSELILLILFFVFMDMVSENAKKDLKDGLVLYNTENNVGLKNAWNIIQAELLGMAFAMTLFQQIHRTGKKYSA
ncbi:hypothetical protein JZ751_003263 [Albula glossodonta]|uniref:Uncharacterized protein n=1 Tax=Albula glossodonta TaxID=121402 RepID=A0A8T2MR39_9TELE|nr:hypothetical protein JZ751_003263 [Albula glossodonta]